MTAERIVALAQTIDWDVVLDALVEQRYRVEDRAGIEEIERQVRALQSALIDGSECAQ